MNNQGGIMDNNGAVVVSTKRRYAVWAISIIGNSFAFWFLVVAYQYFTGAIQHPVNIITGMFGGHVGKFLSVADFSMDSLGSTIVSVISVIVGCLFLAAHTMYFTLWLARIASVGYAHHKAELAIAAAKYASDLEAQKSVKPTKSQALKLGEPQKVWVGGRDAQMAYFSGHEMLAQLDETSAYSLEYLGYTSGLFKTMADAKEGAPDFAKKVLERLRDLI